MGLTSLLFSAGGDGKSIQLKFVSMDTDGINQSKCGDTIDGQTNENADTPIKLICDVSPYRACFCVISCYISIYN